MTDDQLRELGKQLPWDRPDTARRDAVRSSLLDEAAIERHPQRRRWLVVGAAFATGALAAAAAVLLVVRRPAPAVELPNPAQITASSETRFEHQVVATDTGVDEVVHVHAGTIRIAAPLARAGDRVRLATADAEVEGAGDYEATVVGDNLSSVRVHTGSAEIRVVGQRTVMLAAGQTWRASIITSDLSPDKPVPADKAVPPNNAVPAPDKTLSASPDTAVPPPDKALSASPDTAVPPDKVVSPNRAQPQPDKVVSVSPPPDKVVSVSPDRTVPPDMSSVPEVPKPDKAATQRTIEGRFKAGWALLKQGNAREAAVELGAAADAAPADPLAADARYFQAVALVRAGERAQAERVLVTFLDSAPKSLRRGRAAVLLGRLIGERGDVDSARKWLEMAASDPDPAIAAAAKAGLQTLKR